jgi:hypothetical protein
VGHVGRIGSNRALQVEQIPKAAKGSPRKTAVFKGLRLHKLEHLFDYFRYQNVIETCLKWRTKAALCRNVIHVRGTKKFQEKQRNKADGNYWEIFQIERISDPIRKQNCQKIQHNFGH